MENWSENQRRIAAYVSYASGNALEGVLSPLEQQLLAYCAAAEACMAERYPGHDFRFVQVHGRPNSYVPDYSVSIFTVEDLSTGTLGTVHVSMKGETYRVAESFYCSFHRGELNEYVRSLLAREGYGGVIPCLSFAAPVPDTVSASLTVGDLLRTMHMPIKGCVYLPWNCGANAERITAALAGSGISATIPFHLLITQPEKNPTTRWAEEYPEYINGTLRLTIR